jgi:hypothetical protein
MRRSKRQTRAKSSGPSLSDSMAGYLHSLLSVARSRSSTFKTSKLVASITTAPFLRRCCIDWFSRHGQQNDSTTACPFLISCAPRRSALPSTS